MEVLMVHHQQIRLMVMREGHIMEVQIRLMLQDIIAGMEQIIITYTGIYCTSATRTPVSVTVSAPATPVVTASPVLVCTGQSGVVTGTVAIGSINWYSAPGRWHPSR